MSPTSSTVLRNVLIEHFGQVGFAMNVVPRKRFGQMRGSKVRVGKWILVMVGFGVASQDHVVLGRSEGQEAD